MLKRIWGKIRYRSVGAYLHYGRYLLGISALLTVTNLANEDYSWMPVSGAASALMVIGALAFGLAAILPAMQHDTTICVQCFRTIPNRPTLSARRNAVFIAIYHSPKTRMGLVVGGIAILPIGELLNIAFRWPMWTFGLVSAAALGMAMVSYPKHARYRTWCRRCNDGGRSWWNAPVYDPDEPDHQKRV